MEYFQTIGMFPNYLLYLKMTLPIENTRLKEIRKELNLTQSEFAEMLGLGQTTADLERGKTKLSGWTVMTLLKDFSINPLWLFGQSTKKYLNQNQTDILPKTVTVNGVGHENILLVSQKAAAGYGVNVGDPDFIKQLPAFGFPLPQYRNATFRGFQITGDSMVPLVQSQDWVLAKAVSSIDEVRNDNIYIIVEHDNVRLKKLRKDNENNRLKLISLNPDYRDTWVPYSNIIELWEYHSRINFGIERIQGLTLQKVYDEVKELKRRVE